jgi:ribosomal protein S18 acetylase RimI-like enzyme
MNRHPSETETDYIREALNQFNCAHVGDDGHTPLNLIEYDADGSIIGGLLGGTYWGWMYIDILWVREDHRRQGVGSRLLTEAEKEAMRRGCHHVHVDTMSWQAPMFYQKHGYEVIGVLPDIPRGNQKYLLMKALPAE